MRIFVSRTDSSNRHKYLYIIIEYILIKSPDILHILFIITSLITFIIIIIIIII